MTLTPEWLAGLMNAALAYRPTDNMTISAATMVALIDLLAEKDAEVERERALRGHVVHARDAALAEAARQRAVAECERGACDEARAERAALCKRLGAVEVLLADWDAWTGERDYAWKSSPKDRELLRAALGEDTPR